MKNLAYTCIFTYPDGCTQTVVWDLPEKTQFHVLAEDWKHDLKAKSFVLSPLKS